MSETSADVVTVEAGQGRPLVVVHGGTSDEAPWARVAGLLAERFLVIRIRRRLYRLDVPADPATTMAEQAAETVAVARAAGPPTVLVGHSSGAVLYEPPSVLHDLPLGRPDSLDRARAAAGAGRTGRALAIFMRETIGLTGAFGAVAPALGVVPAVRRYLGRQLDDLDSILRLGDRTAAYAGIEVPVRFLTGARSPAHLGERCRRLAAAMPHAEVVTLPRDAHTAFASHPRQLAAVLAAFADSTP